VYPSPLLLWLFIGLLCQPWMIDGDDYGASSEMGDWQGNQSTWRKPDPVLLCPPQIIPHDLNWAASVEAGD
jgi:hypothetical protein